MHFKKCKLATEEYKTLMLILKKKKKARLHLLQPNQNYWKPKIRDPNPVSITAAGPSQHPFGQLSVRGWVTA